MFDNYSAIEIRRETFSTGTGMVYTILSNKRGIGTIEEKASSNKDIWNRLLKLLTLKSAVSLNLKLDAEATGDEEIELRKVRGFYKDIYLHSASKHIATIKPTVKVNSPVITVEDPDGSIMFKASGQYGATDFSVADGKTNQKVTSIRKRSSVYNSMKENLLNEDRYYVDIRHLSYESILIMIGTIVTLDFYFHR